MDSALHIFLLALAAIFPIVGLDRKQRDQRGPPSRRLARCAKRVLRPRQRVVARLADPQSVRHFDTGPSRRRRLHRRRGRLEATQRGQPEGTGSHGGRHHHQADPLDLAFYPLTLPLTTGPGTIAVVISLGLSQGSFSSSTDEAVLVLATLCAIFVIAAAIFVCFAYADSVQRLLGPGGTDIAVRLSAFILFCLGIQILWSGGSELLHSVMHPPPAVPAPPPT